MSVFRIYCQQPVPLPPLLEICRKISLFLVILCMRVNKPEAGSRHAHPCGPSLGSGFWGCTCGRFRAFLARKFWLKRSLGLKQFRKLLTRKSYTISVFQLLWSLRTKLPVLHSFDSLDWRLFPSVPPCFICLFYPLSCKNSPFHQVQTSLGQIDETVYGGAQQKLDYECLRLAHTCYQRLLVPLPP